MQGDAAQLRPKNEALDRGLNTELAKATIGMVPEISLEYKVSMKIQATVPDELLKIFNVSSPSFVEGTAIANVWKVIRPDGRCAALKIYHNRDMKNEGPGVSFMSALNGCGVVKVFNAIEGALLLEWLDGPSLGDLTRSGQDVEASQVLVSVANRIHANRPTAEDDFPTLEAWFHDLFNLQFAAELPSSSRRDLLHCQETARHLIATQTDIRPLHGDLHHDNIRLGGRGYCAFDAKGVLGEKTFELANAFRNPKGAMEIVQNRDRVCRLADSWSGAFGVGRDRLLEWAMVKTALSIAWRSGGMLEADAELGLLSFLRSVVDRD